MPQIEDLSKIEIRSEEVQEIIGNPPRWIIRWGVSILFILVVVLIVGSYFYKYPEVIQSTVIINTENMPAVIVAKSSGKLEEIFVQDKAFVEKNSPLAILENGAVFKDVTLLQQRIDTIKQKLISDTKMDFTLSGGLILGDIQPAYMSFTKALNDYEIYKETDFLAKKAEGIKIQIGQFQKLYAKMVSQTSIYKEQLELIENQLNRDSMLLDSKAISKSDFEKSRNTYLQYKLSYESSKVSLDNTQITIAQMEQNLLEINQQSFEQRKLLLLSLQTAIDNLQNQINAWTKMYVLSTPISGKVAFIKFWSKNQNVQMGNEVFSVVPIAESKIVGKIKLPIKGSGKVKEGQQVNIKLDNYPYLEYGIIIGKINSVSLMPSDDNYSVEVEFPNGLTTNYKKKLAFGQNMQGSAEIITEDIRLIERFIQPLRYILKKQ
ncbi:MAG: HlyD family efflux transporter periplasmic adaptor subunit [Bacteroidales bacterium]|nr:HlyD family efflux transporter periplasmic adaptor subunit [Bacteroidales bacterium]MDY0217403.1 HlyD family efflux transporter periplasmic adaptor subunit [Bacteroidales bacterium]